MDLDESGPGQYFKEDPGVTDVILEVEGRELHVSKSVLMVASPVFKSMFTTGYKEQDAKKIPFPEKEFHSFELFLRCIYPNEHINLDENIIAKVLPLAHEYLVSSVKSQCAEWLLSQIKIRLPRPQQYMQDQGKKKEELEFLMKCLYYGAEYDLNTLYKEALNNVVRHGAEMYWDNEYYKLLSYKHRCELLEKKLQPIHPQMIQNTPIGLFTHNPM